MAHRNPKVGFFISGSTAMRNEMVAILFGLLQLPPLTRFNDFFGAAAGVAVAAGLFTHSQALPIMSRADAGEAPVG